MLLSPEYRKLIESGASEQEVYSFLQTRCDETIANAKVCMGQALNAGDMEAVKDMRDVIQTVELEKATMRKPGEAPKGDA